MYRHVTSTLVAVALVASGCGLERPDPGVAAICEQASANAQTGTGPLIIIEPNDQDLSRSLAGAREECPEALGSTREIEFVAASFIVELESACRSVAGIDRRPVPAIFELERTEGAVTTIASAEHVLRALELEACAPFVTGRDPAAVLSEAQARLICNLVSIARDATGARTVRAASLEQFEKLTASLDDSRSTAILAECDGDHGDRATFVAEVTASIADQQAAQEAERARAEEERAAQAREEREQEAREQRAQIDPALLRCYEQYYAARYLSAQALQASTCIVDKLFFGGVRPTEANTSQLMPEMLFHATWATWNSATRAAYCSDVKRRGFDAAETIGIAMARTWRGQIRAAGSSWALDDYDLVLDVLDTCEEY